MFWVVVPSMVAAFAASCWAIRKTGRGPEYLAALEALDREFPAALCLPGREVVVSAGPPKRTLAEIVKSPPRLDLSRIKVPTSATAAVRPRRR